MENSLAVPCKTSAEMDADAKRQQLGLARKVFLAAFMICVLFLVYVAIIEPLMNPMNYH